MLKRPEMLSHAGGTVADMDVILDQLAAMWRRVPIWSPWRPQLRDANDDRVLEAATNAAAMHLVTFNIRDFGTAPSRFGMALCRPAEIARNLRDGQESRRLECAGAHSGGSTPRSQTRRRELARACECLDLTRHRRVLGWQFLQKRFKRKSDGLRGVEHGSKKLTHRTSPLIFKGLSAMLALMGRIPISANLTAPLTHL